jgi:hypothetical protein
MSQERIDRVWYEVYVLKVLSREKESDQRVTVQYTVRKVCHYITLID